MIAAAERILAETGPGALSVRGVAEQAGTSTWAVYSLFGSLDGLLGAVARQAIAYLDHGLRSMPETDDPASDLIEVGTRMYRAFVIDHPWPYRLAFQRVLPDLVLGADFFAARARTWALLERRLQRLADAGMLGRRTVGEGAVQFNALCEGLANAELRGGTMAPGDQEAIWRGAFEALIGGFAAPTHARRRRGESQKRR